MSLISFNEINIKYIISEASSIVAYAKYKRKNVCIKYNDSMSYTISPNILIEIEVMKNLATNPCPYIIDIQNVVLMNFDLGFTTKFIENKTLNDYIIKKIPIDFDDIFEQIQMGVAHLHNMGYIHRDIKPQNILIDQKNKCIKIIDFGLIYYIHNIGINGNRKIAYKYNVQTKGYQAPEIINMLPYSSKIDTWNIGVIYANYHIHQNDMDITAIEYVDYIIDPHIKSMLSVNPKLRPCLSHKYPSIYDKIVKLSPPYKPDIIDYMVSIHIEWKLCYETIACAITIYCNTSRIMKEHMDMKTLALMCIDLSSCSFEDKPISESALCDILSITKELYFRLRVMFLEIIDFQYQTQTFYDYMKIKKWKSRAMFYKCIHIITNLKIKVNNRMIFMEAKKLLGRNTSSIYPNLNELLRIYI